MEINIADGQIIGQRNEQQDSRVNLQLQNGDYRLYVLADGMGGQIGGALASKEVIKGFVNYFENRSISENPSEDLMNALNEANQRITEILREQPHMNGMGSTVIAVLHQKQTNLYWFVSVGDSPLYKWSEGQGLVRINANHAYYEELLKQVSQGKLSQEEADNHEQRHAITSALMGKEIELVDVQSGKLAQHERMLIASDGVQTLNDQTGEALDLLIRENLADLNKSISEILKAVSDKKYPYQDNTTLILVKPFSGETSDESAVVTEVITVNSEEVSSFLSKDKQKTKQGIYKSITLIFLVSLMLVGGIATFYFEPIKSFMTVLLSPESNVESIEASVSPESDASPSSENNLPQAGEAIDQKPVQLNKDTPFPNAQQTTGNSGTQSQTNKLIE